MLDIIAGVKVESSGQVYCSKGVAYVAQASNLYATQTVSYSYAPHRTPPVFFHTHAILFSGILRQWLCIINVAQTSPLGEGDV